MLNKSIRAGTLDSLPWKKLFPSTHTIAVAVGNAQFQPSPRCLQQSPSVLLQKDPDRLPNGRVSCGARLRDSALA